MTGQQLHKLVWSMSLGKAAASFPMSHLALKEALRAAAEEPDLCPR
ncbi:hypothetical protein RSO01_92750 [Reyranella soli]|uniref:Uncharacterized protein n=1 Tax=Reyranella soli TaxID=1230389 RepID=A0A512NT57_9HYPH|nr:hypothetical protein RSO01_92750 [Reyranella soli]